MRIQRNYVEKGLINVPRPRFSDILSTRKFIRTSIGVYIILFLQLLFYFINIHTLQHIHITFPWCIKHKYTTPRRFATCPLVHTPRAPHKACVCRLSFARVCGSPAEDPQQSTLAPKNPKLPKLLKLLKSIKFLVIVLVVVVLQYTHLLNRVT